MRIAEVRVVVREWAMPLTTNARAQWSSRSSVLLDLIDDEGRVGRGEASPLPGYSPDTLAEARVALAALAPTMLAVDHEAADPLGEIARVLECLGTTLPSARFALETALLDLVGQRRGVSVALLLTASGCVFPVPLSGRVEGSAPEQALGQARALFARGVGTAKMKIGVPGMRESELACLAAISGAHGDRLALRVDANRSLHAAELGATLDALAMLGVVLIEEPASFEIVRTLERSPVPVALDESLARPDLDAWLDDTLDRGAVGAVVLKPPMLGGVIRARAIAERAREHGVGSIVTHTLDGPRGWAAAASLALALPHPHEAAGLDRHGGLDAFAPGVRLPGFDGATIVPLDAPGLGLDAELELTR